MATSKNTYKKGSIITKNIIWAVLSFGILLIVWYIAALITGKSSLIPMPNLVARETLKLLGEGEFYSALYATIMRCAVSLLISFSVAIILAMLSIVSRPLYKLLAPLVTIFRAIPTMSVIFILIMLFSPKDAPIFVTFLVAMPAMYSMHISAFLSTDKELIETGRVFGYSKLREITHIHIPLALPVLIESIAGGFSLSLKILVAAEVLASTANCIGYLLFLANSYIETARLFAITIIIITICIVVEVALRALNERITKRLY